jgi:putative transposase
MEKALAHTSWECKYHIVFVPKNRRKVIYGRLRRDLGQVLRKLCEYKQVEVIEGMA